MAITELLQQILSARYGRDVRQSIHDAIRTCYDDGKAGAIDLTAREQIEVTKGDITTLQGDTTQLKTDVQTISGDVETLGSDVDQLNKDLNGFAFKTEDGEKKVYNPSTEAWEDFGGGSGASTWSDVADKPFETIGDGLKVENNALKADVEPYELPIASTTILGGVKADGTTTTIDADGTIHAIGGGGSQDVSIDTSGESFELDTQEGTLKITKIEGKSVTTDSGIFSAGSMGCVDLGSLSWNKSSAEARGFYADIINGKEGKVYCLKYPIYSRTGAYYVEKQIVGNVNGFGQLRIQIKDSDYSSASSFKESLSGTLFAYEVADGATPDSYALVVNEHNADNTQSKTVTFPLSAPLRSIGDVKDVVENGQITRYVGVVDLDSLTWSYASGNKYWYASFPSLGKDTPMLADNYTYASSININTSPMHITSQVANRIDVKTNGVDSSDTKPIGKAYYILSTPTTENLSATQMSALNALVTYDGKTFIDTTDTLAKATLYINNKKDNGIISDAWNASKMYAQNDYVIQDNVLYKCLLANSGVIPPNATYWKNCTVGTELGQLNNDLSEIGGGKWVEVESSPTSVPNNFTEVKYNLPTIDGYTFKKVVNCGLRAQQSIAYITFFMPYTTSVMLKSSTTQNVTAYGMAYYEKATI